MPPVGIAFTNICIARTDAKCVLLAIYLLVNCSYNHFVKASLSSYM